MRVGQVGSDGWVCKLVEENGSKNGKESIPRFAYLFQQMMGVFRGVWGVGFSGKTISPKTIQLITRQNSSSQSIGEWGCSITINAMVYCGLQKILM